MSSAIVDSETRRFGRLMHYAGVLATVLTATVGYSLACAPVKQSTADTAQRIDELLLSTRNGPSIRKHHAKAALELADVSQRIEQIKGRVPSKPSAGEFLKEITRIASDEQLSLRNFHPETPVEHDGYSELDIKLQGDGSYASICSFFDRLSKLKRLSKVKSLTLSADDNSGEYPLEATLTIYYGLEGKKAETMREARDD